MPKRNDLQLAADKLAADLSPLYSAVSEQLNNGVSPAKALKEAGYYEEVEQKVLNSVVAAAEVGVKGTSYLLAAEKYREWYVGTNHLGGKLSDNIRTLEARNAITGVLKEGLAIDNSVIQLSDTLNRTKGTAGFARIPKQLEKLKHVSKSSPAELKKEIAKAERYIKSLKGGRNRGSQQLKTAYTQLVNAAKRGELSQKHIEKAVERKLRYINERIARTEMANSYELSRRRAYDADPEVNAFEWVLSPAHPVVDECDYYADADLYGMGAGVYPLSSGVAAPAHPNCLCTTYPIKGDVKKGRYSEERSQEYLKGLSEKDRNRVIGKGTPLKDSRKVLNNKGVNPTAKRRAMMPADMLEQKEGRE